MTPAVFIIPAPPVPYLVPPASLGVGAISASAALSTSGAIALKLAPATGPAAPFVAAAAGLMELGSALVNLFHGCGETCVIAAGYADQGTKAAQLVQNQYFALPVRHYSDQQTAINAISSIADWMLQGWSELGDVGKQYTEQHLNAPENQCRAESPQPGQGKCSLMKAFCCAILEDPMAVPDPTPATVAETLTQDLGGSMMPLVLGVGLLALLVIAL
jgi:hypothetical protein